MIHNKRTSRTFLFLFLICGFKSFSQTSDGLDNSNTVGQQYGDRVIRTGVPFLLIAPDSRSGAMGDVGAAISPDANASHWNPSKLAFVTNNTGLAFSYSPWLQKIVPDINLAYVSAYHRLSDRDVIGASLRYFSLGEIQFTDINNNPGELYTPSEFALDGTYARSFGENFSLGLTGRFIYSNLANGQAESGADRRPATAFAADASAYYKKETQLFGTDARIAGGLNISNIGNKISYEDGGEKTFLPTNMKLGGASTFYIDSFNEFTFALDINKLLVPTPSNRDLSNVSVPSGIFSSFSDAPGGFKEEMQELSYSTGLEYWYNKQFALRTGYFYESPSKGDRQYLTVGAGLKYSIFNIDFAYLLANQNKSPLANTLRFSLVFNFEGRK